MKPPQVSEIDLAQCAAPRCTAATALSAPERKLDNSAPPLCATAAPVALVKRWESTRRTFDCGTGAECSPGSSAIAAAPDGSLWIVAGLSTDDPLDAKAATGVLLTHTDADGAVLDEHVVDRTPMPGVRAYAVAIVVDARGHAFASVSATQYEARDDGRPIASTSWLEEYDERAVRVGERIPIRGSLDAGAPLLSTGDDSVAVMLSAALPETANAGRRQAGVAVLARDRTLRWSQPRTNWSARSLVADRDGHVNVHSQQQIIEQYDRDGELLRSLSFSELVRDAFLAADAEGNLVLTGYFGGNQGGHNFPIDLVVQKLGAIGEPLWLAHASVPQGVGDDAELGRYGTGGQHPVVDAQGTIFIPGGASKDGEVWRTNVYEFSADGVSCMRHELLADRDGIYSYVEQLAIGSQGELYYDFGASYGRFER
jgi:hypothetical protein